MFKKMKLIGVSLLLVMAALASACSNGKSDPSAAPATSSGSVEETGEKSLKPYEIVMAIPVFGAIPKDIEAVQNEISKIAQQKINATVKILPISVGAWGQQMNLMASSGEKLDLAYAFGTQGYYTTQAATGKVVELDELLEKHGQGVKEALGEFLEGARYGGKLYGVPTLDAYASIVGVYMREDIVQKYSIDTSSIQNLDDLEKVYELIKANEPTMTPLAAGLNNPVQMLITSDKLGDSYGVLPDTEPGLQIANLYESAEYADLLNRVHRWFKAGYLNRDAATSKVSNEEMVRAGKAFSFFAGYYPGALENEERSAGKPLVFVPMKKQAYLTNQKVMQSLYTISVNSKDPERTMMFLNLMYSDKEVANLLAWGIEGKHYVKVSDNVIDYPAGIDSATVGYSLKTNLVGNPFLTYTMKDQDPDVWNETKKFNDEAVKSKALGFNFNSNPVKNEITALNNVVEQYRKILETGTVNPADKLKEFNDKLKAAGLEKVIAEKQKQLNEWAASQK